MADQTAVRTQTTAEILGNSQARELLEDIFSDFHPGFINQTQAITSIFTPQSAASFLTQLTDFENVLSAADTYEATVKKFQGLIDTAEAIRDQLLAQIFEQIRPLERSYRQVSLFFENAKVADSKARKPVEFYILNADSKAMKHPIESMNVAAIDRFVRQRNDNFNFRDDICNLVVPGYLPQPVREKLEDLANTWGMLLICDTDDEKSFRNVERNFEPGGKYVFTKRPEDRAAADVMLTNYLQLRPAYSFEKTVDGGDDLYGPPSLLFAAALVRTDESQGLAQGPVGSRFGQVTGAEGSRFEPLISEMESLTMDRQLIPVIRDADNHLCFQGSRGLAEDPYGVLKFFTSYRVLRYIERCCRHYLLGVAGQVLTRDFMDENIDKPLRRLLTEQVEQGTLLDFTLDVDRSFQKRMQGICDISVTITPTGPAETFILRLDVPEFKGDSKDSKP
jgi:Type VI secretion system, TssC, VipB